MFTRAKRCIKPLVLCSLAVSLLVTAPYRVFAQDTRAILFPVLGGGSFNNDFDASRPNGLHHATDIFAAKHTPIVSPVDGIIYYVVSPQASWGYSIGIRDNDGYEYNLIHMNNDTPGTDNSSGGEMNAYAPDMKQNNLVVKGQFLGWVGDSGNAETTPPHLHFEIYDPNGNPLNPYFSLISAPRIGQAVVNPNPMPGETLPYGAYVKSRAQVAIGNVDDDEAQEIIVSPGQGSTPNIKVLTKTGDFDNKEFMAYDLNFKGGVTVACGDIDGDGVDEIITGTGPGNATHIKVFKANGSVISSFFAYGQYATGATIAAGDFNGDSKEEIITGTGPGASTHVKIFKANGEEQSSFFAYPGYTPGVNVAVGDVDNDGINEIVTAPGPGGSAHIKLFNVSGNIKGSFLAYDNFYGGVSIDVGNIKSNQTGEEIITSPYSNGGADIRLYKANGQIIASKGLYERWWIGGYEVAAGDGFSWVSTGQDRRTSMRMGPN